MLFTFEYGHWHAWESVSGFYLSNERSKTLTHHNTLDDVITHLYSLGNQDAARALNSEKKMREHIQS